MDLKGRDFLTLKDYTPEEILYLIDLAAELKDKKKKGIVEQPLIGKNVARILYFIPYTSYFVFPLFLAIT